ncbi:hypothetical protein [Myroides sp. LJL119]
MQQTIQQIIKNNELHAKWLNTLSYLENVGARKISACEQDHTVDLIQLKHAAEEHRHAYYLKKQISKVLPESNYNYNPGELLAAIQTKHYLNALDLKVARFLKNKYHLNEKDLKYACYLFVTYAIEVRADILYPIYQEQLNLQKSKVLVKSIILEEEGHLQEMVEQLNRFDKDWQDAASIAISFEQELFNYWLKGVKKELKKHEVVK